MQTKYDLSDSIACVTVESKEMNVRLGGGLVPFDADCIIFFSYMATTNGEKLENVGSEFPTVPGTYIAAIAANEGSGSHTKEETQVRPFFINLYPIRIPPAAVGGNLICAI